MRVALVPEVFELLGQRLQRDAVAIVFLNVLLQQLGLPVPAVPTLLLTGSLAAAPGQLG
jgi:membrane protein DedA with SNARE-associated domain